jgi:hypothetical protein
MNITVPGVRNQSEAYRGFLISWQEPPLTGAKWTANVATESVQLLNLMGGNGATVIDGRSREEIILMAKGYIDDLLDRAHSST